MGFHSCALRSVTVFLAILLAWPWNLALLSADPPSDDAPSLAGAALVAARPQIQKGGRHGRCEQGDSPAFTQVFDRAEEEDAGGSLPLATGPALVPGPPEMLALAPPETVFVDRSPSPTRVRTCGLRC